jgi:prevent-host-death family protein
VRTIPQRELRNQIGRVLREVESGERVRVTVAGRPVADLVPVVSERRAFVPRSAIDVLRARTPLDPAFRTDLEAAVGDTIEDL